MKRCFFLLATFLWLFMLASSAHATLMLDVASGSTNSFNLSVTGAVGTYDIKGDLIDNGINTLKLTNLYIRATSVGGASDTIYFTSPTAAGSVGTTAPGGSTTVEGSWTHDALGFSSTPVSVNGGELRVTGWISGMFEWNGIAGFGLGSGGLTYQAPTYHFGETFSWPIGDVGILSGSGASFGPTGNGNSVVLNQGQLFFANYITQIDLTDGLAGTLDFNLANQYDGLYLPGSIDITTATAVPEPASLLLIGSGLLGMIGSRKWRK